jgi:cation-transporting P-type ATPase I
MGTMAAAMELDEAEQSPLGARLGKLLWQSLPLTTAASAVVVASGLLRRQPLMPQLVVGASMALAAIPEGLPMLAGMGQGGVARRLARRNALVRRLSAVEALGRVDVACVDKTGTMTQGRLSLSLVADMQSDAQLPGKLPPHLAEVLLTAAYASPHPEASGAAAHPTDVVVVQAATASGLGERLHEQRGSEDPFDPVQGFHVTAINGRLCLKGAPETLLPRCGKLRIDGEDRPLDDAGRERLL